MNRKINDILLGSEAWMADEKYMGRLLNRYLYECYAVKNGVPFSELGIKERFKAAESYTANKVSDSGEVKGNNGVRVIHLRGAMMLDGGLSTRSIREFSKEISLANADDSVSAIVVSANTGGGEVLAGQEAYNAVKESKKPVIFHSDYLASAGVLASLPAAERWAAGDFSSFGSIGVMATLNKSVIEELKNNEDELYSEYSDNKNEEFRAYKEGDTSKYIKRLTSIDKVFMRKVVEHLELKGDEATKKETLSGRMFNASEALNRGLIDNIGTLNEAIERAFELSQKNISTQENMDFLKNTKLYEMLFGASETTVTESDITSRFDTLASELTQMKSDIKVANDSIVSLTEKVATLEAENLQLKQAITLKEEAITAIANEKINLEGEISSLKAEKADLNKEIAQLKAQNGNIGNSSNTNIINSEQVTKNLGRFIEF